MLAPNPGSHAKICNLQPAPCKLRVSISKPATPKASPDVHSRADLHQIAVNCTKLHRFAVILKALGPIDPLTRSAGRAPLASRSGCVFRPLDLRNVAPVK